MTSGSRETSVARHPPVVRQAARKRFRFEKTAYLSDTNAEGNVYFAKYFEWAGQAREAFAREAVPTIVSLLQGGITLVTCEASIKYLGSVYLYDEVSIEIGIAKLCRGSLELTFCFTRKDTGTLLALGRQRIALRDAAGALIPVPEEIRCAALPYLTDEALAEGRTWLPP